MKKYLFDIYVLVTSYCVIAGMSLDCHVQFDVLKSYKV